MAQPLGDQGQRPEAFYRWQEGTVEEGGCPGYVPPLPGFQPLDSHFLHPEYKDQATSGSLPHHGSVGFFSLFLEG